MLHGAFRDYLFTYWQIVMISVVELDDAAKTGRKPTLVVSDRARGQDARALRTPCLPI